MRYLISVLRILMTTEWFQYRTMIAEPTSVPSSLGTLVRPNMAANTARLSGLGLAMVISYAALNATFLPFAWFFLTWFILLLYLGVSSRASMAKTLWINLSAVALALGLGEVYVWSVTPEKTNSYCCDYMLKDDSLGRVPRKNFAATHIKTINSVPIYKATYTIDADGLRIAPPYDSRHGLGSALFFGCSFTFGEGVGDHETMPYVTGLLSQGRYAIYNFGFHGYGPQQMLAALERGLVQSIVKVPPKYVIYQAIPYHFERVAGLTWWFPHNLRYGLTGGGRVAYQGHFDDVEDESRYSPPERFWRAQGPIGERIRARLEKSFIYKTLVSPYRSLSHKDVQLFIEIVNQAREEVAARYPASEFHVLLWDNEFRQQNFLQFLPQVLDGFKRYNLRVHLVSDMIPDYDASTPNIRYELDKHDGHPNPLTNRLIATYVARNIIHVE